MLEACLDGLSELHDALDDGEGRHEPAQRTLVRTTTGGGGRRPTAMLAPTAEQRRAVKVFELERWFPTLLSCMAARRLQT